MLYRLLLLPARVGINFYCRKIIINDKSRLRLKGPLLIAANHPNSFLDAIVLASVFRYPIYSLARGDAFAGKFFTQILKGLNMLPVYRVSEGVQNLDHNYVTFDACQELFKRNKVVLIFSEGRCVNEWHLRPLKKGTARLALSAWMQNIPLKILPLGFNYSSFRRFGKVVHLNFGTLITEQDIYEDLSSGKAINEFNQILHNQLKQLVYDIDSQDKATLKKVFSAGSSPKNRILLAFPAVAGFVLHAFLYYTIHYSIRKKAGGHYDSIMTGALFLLYPLYILLTTMTFYFATKSLYALLLIPLMPLTALALLHFRKVIR